jgi:periplasmic protein TonB
LNDAVDRVIVERAALERGFPGGLILSGAAHALLLASIFVLPLILPKEPPLKVLDGFAVPLPPGGGGPANPEPPAPAPAAPEPAPQTLAPAPAPTAEPPKVLKPPTEAPPKNRLPEPDAKPVKKKPERVAEARPQLTDAERAYTRGAPSGAPRGTGRASTTPGLEFGPPGAGVPGGTDPFGDWYLAGVQRKIWTIWTQQLKGDLRQPIAVLFTILADGSVTDVRVAQGSGAALLDLAATRAVYSAGPFGPLPKDYGTNRYTIQAIFKPVQ